MWHKPVIGCVVFPEIAKNRPRTVGCRRPKSLTVLLLFKSTTNRPSKHPNTGAESPNNKIINFFSILNVLSGLIYLLIVVAYLLISRPPPPSVLSAWLPACCGCPQLPPRSVAFWKSAVPPFWTQKHIRFALCFQQDFCFFVVPATKILWIIYFPLSFASTTYPGRPGIGLLDDYTEEKLIIKLYCSTWW